MLQRPVHEDGASEGLDHVIVRVSNILGHGLETLPHRREPSILQALRQALRDGSGQTIRATADDYVMRSYLWVEDAAECVGRIATGKHGGCSHDVVTVGDPDNQASAIEVAQRIIRTYRERYWDGAGELPQLRVPALRIHRPVHAVPLPSVERARELIGWSPRFSMSDAVEAMLRGLMEPGPGRAQALRRMSLNPR